MEDKDANLRADLRYIIMYAQQLLKDFPADGKASSADVGFAQRLSQLAASVHDAVEDRQGN
jgi:hypothetical protein